MPGITYTSRGVIQKQQSLWKELHDSFRYSKTAKQFLVLATKISVTLNGSFMSNKG